MHHRDEAIHIKCTRSKFVPIQYALIFIFYLTNNSQTSCQSSILSIAFLLLVMLAFTNGLLQFLKSLPCPSFFGAFDDLNISIISFVMLSGNTIFDNILIVLDNFLLVFKASNLPRLFAPTILQLLRDVSFSL